MAPLSYVPLDHGCAFSSEAVPEGIVATAGRTLRIISVDTAGMDGGDDEAFNTTRVALRYTPRQMTLLSTAKAGTQQRKVVVAVVESDYDDFGLEDKNAKGFDPVLSGQKKKGKNKASKGGDEDDAMDMDEDSDDENEKKEDDNAEDEDEEGGGEGDSSATSDSESSSETPDPPEAPADE